VGKANPFHTKLERQLRQLLIFVAQTPCRTIEKRAFLRKIRDYLVETDRFLRISFCYYWRAEAAD
jgi:hypothetical protein